MNIQLERYSVNISTDFQQQIEWIQRLGKKNYSSIFILVDENTLKFCYPKVKDHVPEHELLIIKSGEKEKNIETCKYLWNKLNEKNAERKSILINLGGGVIGDMGGFVASTFKRGLDFINVPTTLLSQVDASVGGKLGIDFNGIKNLIGIFNDPQGVLICTEFLNTLEINQVKSGFAEILKHGLIHDKFYWETTCNIDFKNAQNWDLIIERSIAIKKFVVESDPYEAGLRKILNFGHTIGHAIETRSLENDPIPLLHGEAIIIGMICETWISAQINFLSKNEMNEVVEKLIKNYNKYDLRNISHELLINYMKSDKKNADGSIMFSLLNSIGGCDFNKKVPDELISGSLNFYNQL